MYHIVVSGRPIYTLSRLQSKVSTMARRYR